MLGINVLSYELYAGNRYADAMERSLLTCLTMQS